MSEGWRLRAACRGMVGPDSPFFPLVDDERPNGRGMSVGDLARISEAQAVCARCEVRETCLRVALENREPFGVWGGLTKSERRKLLAQRGERLNDQECAWFRCRRWFIPVSSQQRFCCRLCKWSANEQDQRDREKAERHAS